MTEDEEAEILTLAGSLFSGTRGPEETASALKDMVKDSRVVRAINRRAALARAVKSMIRGGEGIDVIQALLPEMQHAENAQGWARESVAPSAAADDELFESAEPLEGEDWKRANSQKG